MEVIKGYNIKIQSQVTLPSSTNGFCRFSSRLYQTNKKTYSYKVLVLDHSRNVKRLQNMLTKMLVFFIHKMEPVTIYLTLIISVHKQTLTITMSNDYKLSNYYSKPIQYNSDQ
jgi:hypothetical protein